MPDLSWLKTTKPQPDHKPESIPAKAQWISGEGAGSWFFIEKGEQQYFIITRFDPNGNIECKSYFVCNDPTGFFPERPFKLLYLSHCREVRTEQDGKQFLFSRHQKII